MNNNSSSTSDVTSKPKGNTLSRMFSSVNSKQYLLIFFVTLLSIIIIFPFLIMIFLSAKSYPQILVSFWAWPDPIMWGNYVLAIKIVLPYLLNSIIVSAGVVGLVFVVGGLTGYALARISFKGSSFIFIGLLSLFVVPGVLIMPTQYLIMTQIGINKFLFKYDYHYSSIVPAICNFCF